MQTRSETKYMKSLIFYYELWRTGSNSTPRKFLTFADLQDECIGSLCHLQSVPSSIDGQAWSRRYWSSFAVHGRARRFRQPPCHLSSVKFLLRPRILLARRRGFKQRDHLLGAIKALPEGFQEAGQSHSKKGTHLLPANTCSIGGRQTQRRRRPERPYCRGFLPIGG